MTISIYLDIFIPMDMQPDFDLLLSIKALADETRLRLLHIANRFELNVNEIVETMAMGQSRISRHLKILAHAGLITARRDGLWTFYSASGEGQSGEFVTAVLQFLSNGSPFFEDLERARRVIEERGRETRRFFDSIAGSWREMKREIVGDAGLDAAIERLLPGCGSAADLGCGSGDLLPVLIKKAGYVIGVDSSSRMLEEASEKYRTLNSTATIDLRLGELEHLPLRDAEVDCVLINMALHHLADPGKSLAEAARVLKSGGMLLVVDLSAHNDETMRTRFGDRWLGFEPAELKMMIQEQGLRVAANDSISLKKNLKALLILAKKQDKKV